MSALSEVESAIGATVNLQLQGGAKLSGQIYAYDRACGLVVLETAKAGAPDKRDWSMVNTSAIEAVEVVERANGDQSDLPAIDMGRLREREHKAVAQHAERLRQIGNGVTAEAQQIFDWLSKTLPCVWQGASIVVMDVVVITPPYADADAKLIEGGGGASGGGDIQRENALARVRKVLAAEKAKARA